MLFQAQPSDRIIFGVLGRMLHAADASSVERPKYGRRSLWLLSHTFGLNHAAVTTPILYQTDLLGKKLGNYDNATLYCITMLTSFFLAPLLNDVLGSKVGLFCSMGGYAAYVFLFAGALFAADMEGTDNEGTLTCWMLALVGSVLGGVAAGLLWTSQGVVLSKICASVAEKEGKPLVEISTELASTFGLIFLLWEAVMRAGYTGLDYVLDAEVIFVIYGALAALAAGAFLFMPSVSEAKSKDASMCGKASKAVELWADPKLWLLQLTNLTFGFAAAWNASYIGPTFIAKDPIFSSSFIGFMGAIISLIGGVGSKALGWLGRCMGKNGKFVIVVFGAICFLAIGALSKVFTDGSDMGFGVLIFPILMGFGRAVYESTNKGVFVDFFPGDKSPGAFANVMAFGTLSSSVVFVLNSTDASSVVIWLLMAFAVCTPPSIAAAMWLKSRSESNTSLLK